MILRPSATFLQALACASLALMMTSCGLFTPRPPAKAQPLLYEWQDDGGPGEISVKIDLSEQIAIYERGGRTIGWSFVSSGKEGHSTSPGDYAIMEKMDVKESNRYGWLSDAAGKVTNGDATPKTPVPPGEVYHAAPMHFWMRVTGYGVGLHAGEIPRPGEAASHGCIRLPRDFAPILYSVTKVGTPVKVVRGKTLHRPKSPVTA
ncbi:MAG: L,D-transpeptidase family protein [Luteolibacter sp.]